MEDSLKRVAWILAFALVADTRSDPALIDGWSDMWKQRADLSDRTDQRLMVQRTTRRYTHADHGNHGRF